MHAWFQSIEWLNTNDPRPPVADETLLAGGKKLFPTADDRWLREQLNDFKHILAQPTVARAFSRPLDDETELWREQEFVVQMKDCLLRGRFDRVAIYREDHTAVRAELIDFKTDRVTPDRCRETADQYQPQLMAYREALSRMLGLDAKKIRTWLLFVETDVQIEIGL